MTDFDEIEAELKMLRPMLAEANKTIRSQERQLASYGQLVQAAQEVIKWAEWGGANYAIGRKPIDDLRAALAKLRQ